MDQNQVNVAPQGRVRPKRKCSVCGQLGYHDSKNCPVKKKSCD